MSSVIQEQYSQSSVAPRAIVYFTTQSTEQDNVEGEDNSFINKNTSLQLVSLPIEYNDTEAVIALFEGTIEKMAALAVLMPIMASMGGNAGTVYRTKTGHRMNAEEALKAKVKEDK